VGKTTTITEGEKMAQEIQTIDLGGTNCYLVKTDSGHILIDTGFPFQRSKLEEALEGTGCKPENLELVVITHGDIDHTGNCAYLRKKYGVRIAMHEGDTEMCLKDGMTRERGKMPADFPLPLMVLWLAKGFLAFALGQVRWRKPFDKFEPDLLLEEGESLAAYGVDAKILYTPGHSKGSVSVLTDDGNLLCGDLFSNAWGRILKSTDEGGLERLRELGVETFYPGHGKSFSMEQVLADR
jgi:glyoxylase-like metal-dependent hydrolase (beta-lactamase superfamily II)